MPPLPQITELHSKQEMWKSTHELFRLLLKSKTQNCIAIYINFKGALTTE